MRIVVVSRDGEVVDGDEKRLTDYQLLAFVKDVSRVLAVMAAERNLKAVIPSLRACALSADASMKRRDKAKQQRRRVMSPLVV